jgi:RecB family exonuclease
MRSEAWSEARSEVRIEARRVRAAARLRPVPAERALARRALGLREQDSASSIEALLGCPLAYVLRYVGEVVPGLSTPAARPGPQLYGHLVHHVIARVLAGGALAPDEAARRAGAILDAELSGLAETLMLPDHQVERAEVRRAIIEAARAVATSIAAAGARVRGVEERLAGKVGPAVLSSRADLLLAEPDHVIDIKWGGSRQRDELRAGAAVQLALYAALARTGPRLPGVAYLLARAQRLVAARGTNLPGASEPTPFTAEELLRVTEAALERRRDELLGGELAAPGAAEDAPVSELLDGALRVAPPCGYCELDGLCGRRWRP